MKSRNGKIQFSDELQYVMEIKEIKNAWLENDSILIKTNQDYIMSLSYTSEQKALKDFKTLNKLLKKEWLNQ